MNAAPCGRSLSTFSSDAYNIGRLASANRPFSILAALPSEPIVSRLPLALLLVALTLPLTACTPNSANSGDTPNDGATQNGSSTTQADGEPAAATDAHEYQLIEYPELAGVVEAHRGQVVVVDLWATWCGHCIQELPNMVKLVKSHGDDVHGIAVNLDHEGRDGKPGPTDEQQQKIQRVLDKFDIDVQNLVSKTPIDDVLEDLNVAAGLPACIVYDKEGNVVKVFDGQFSYDKDVAAVVDQLLSGQ